MAFKAIFIATIVIISFLILAFVKRKFLDPDVKDFKDLPQQSFAIQTEKLKNNLKTKPESEEIFSSVEEIINPIVEEIIKPIEVISSTEQQKQIIKDDEFKSVQTEEVKINTPVESISLTEQQEQMIKEEEIKTYSPEQQRVKKLLDKLAISDPIQRIQNIQDILDDMPNETEQEEIDKEYFQTILRALHLATLKRKNEQDLNRGDLDNLYVLTLERQLQTKEEQLKNILNTLNTKDNLEQQKYSSKKQLYKEITPTIPKKQLERLQRLTQYTRKQVLQNHQQHQLTEEQQVQLDKENKIRKNIHKNLVWFENELTLFEKKIVKCLGLLIRLIVKGIINIGEFKSIVTNNVSITLSKPMKYIYEILNKLNSSSIFIK